jgi:hypothetical protein
MRGKVSAVTTGKAKVKELDTWRVKVAHLHIRDRQAKTTSGHTFF